MSLQLLGARSTMAAVLIACAATARVAAQPAIDGYADYPTYNSQVEALASPPATQPPLVQVRSLGETLGATLDFLGFTVRRERDLYGRATTYLRVEPSRKAETRLREKVREQTGPRWGWRPVPLLVARLNQTLRGWHAYFRYGHPQRVFQRLNGYVLTRLCGHLRRRSQRRYRPPTGTALPNHLSQLGLIILHRRDRPVHA